MFPIFKNYSNLFLAISQKKDGSMAIKINEGRALKNRERFLRKLKIESKNVIIPILKHGARVKIVKEKDRGKVIKDVDGLLTQEKNLFLTITVADCLPVFIFDLQKEVIGLVHAGWRGLVKDILVGVGPAICQKHYEVKERVMKKFQSFSDCF